MSNKRYFWLKLKEDFFDDDGPIEWLEEQTNGKEYALFYLKLCLKSLKSDGILMRQVGSIMVPYDAEKLAEITRTDVDTVMVALQLLKKIGLVEVLDTGAIFMTQLSAMVGSETNKAAYMRQRRAQKALENGASNSEVTMLPECGNKLGTGVTAEYRDKSIEIREKEIYKEKDGEQAAPASSPPLSNKADKDKKKPVKHKHGEYKNVLLTNEELKTLRELFPHDHQDRIERLSEYIESTGKKYKSHYATIRAWANRDKKQGGNYGKAAKSGNVGPNGIVIDPEKDDLDGAFR